MNGNSRFFFVIFAVSAAIGLGNFLIYPYFSFGFSGLFIVAYAVSLIVIGIPLLMMEISIGQYFKKNIVDLFSQIHKGFKFIGWYTLINSFIVLSYYVVLLSWNLIYFFVSIGHQWKDNPKSYFFDNVLQISDGLNNFTSFSMPLFISLLMSWIIIYFFIRNGYESIKKGLAIIMPLFSILLIFFFFYVLTLESSLFGIHSLLQIRDIKLLLDIDMWIAAMFLAVVSIGVSFGIMSSISKKSKKEFILGSSSIVVAFELFISIALGFIVFGMLGFLAGKQDAGLIIFSDYAGIFDVLSQALPFFYRPTLLSMLFFMFFMMIFIMGAAALSYAISNVLVQKFNAKNFQAAVLISGLGFLMGLLFIIRPGYYIMDIMSHFVFYNMALIILFECISIGWFYKIDKLKKFIDQNSMLKVGNLWEFSIRYLIPLVILILLYFQIKSDLALDYNNYPLWAVLLFGAGAVIIPLVISFFLPRKMPYR
jgi:neurotransmitter:Na+ symporter, NSS family